MNILELMPLLDAKSPEPSKKRTGNIYDIEYNGKSMSITEWAKELNISLSAMSKRHKKYEQGKIDYSDVFKKNESAE